MYDTYPCTLISAASEKYNLRARKHNRLLPQRTTRISLVLILFTELLIRTFINFLLNYILMLLCCGLSTF